MFGRLKRATSGATSRLARPVRRGAGVKFRLDVKPVGVESSTAALMSTTTTTTYVLRWSRGAKVQVSRASTSDVAAGTIATWATDDAAATSSSIATLFKRNTTSASSSAAAAEEALPTVGASDISGGLAFEPKDYCVKLQRVDADPKDGLTKYVTVAKGAVDIAAFASVDGPMETRKISLNVKSSAAVAALAGAKTLTLTVEARVVWLKNFVPDMDTLTDLSLVSGIESNWSASVKTDATPPESSSEQDLSGFPGIPGSPLQVLLSPVAGSVSPIVVRQIERRESIAREALDNERRKVAQLEVILEETKEETGRTIRLLMDEKKELSAELKRAMCESETARAQAQSEKEAKDTAIMHVIDDMNAIENEKKSIEKERNNLELQVQNLERTLRERDSDIARLVKNAATAPETASTMSFEVELERERIEHAKEIDRYRLQLDASDTQLAKLSLEYKKKTKALEGELQTQAKARAASEELLQEELDDKNQECEELRQHLQSVIAETTMLTTSLKRAANEAHETKLNAALAEAAIARCDLTATSEELADVRKVLDSHVIELVTSKVALAESQGALLEVRRELLRTKQKVSQMAARATKMEVAYAASLECEDENANRLDE